MKAILHTTAGDITVELFPNHAPNTVTNFVSLATGEREWVDPSTGQKTSRPLYDGTIFHRVIPGFMIQGGDPQGTGTGGPGYCIPGEFSHNGFANDLKHSKGVLSMARTMVPDSAGSQFFIMHETSPHLDGDYAAFGQVIEGLDVIDAIANTDRDWNDKPLSEQKMKRVTVETFGVDYPEPEKC